MITNSTKATAEAEPRLHHLKPSSYMKYKTVMVRAPGPTCVINVRLGEQLEMARHRQDC